MISSTTVQITVLGTNICNNFFAHSIRIRQIACHFYDSVREIVTQRTEYHFGAPIWLSQSTLYNRTGTSGSNQRQKCPSSQKVLLCNFFRCQSNLRQCADRRAYPPISTLTIHWNSEILLQRAPLQVQFSDGSSETKPIVAGVPQGSVPGPLLYVMHMSTADMPTSNDNPRHLRACHSYPHYLPRSRYRLSGPSSSS